ncbi:MAG: EAL domain-containing protein [Clostridia bacterium]|nr:EAL domain-containing protein [Clostridia bacterium]
MPVMDGKTVLKRMRSRDLLSQIPVIVLTSETDAEVESLQMGAADFIKKPYDMPAVIMARVNRTVELAEDRHIIDVAETDDLTGLYNREFFFEYASTMDERYPGTRMDAIVVDMDHFHLYNEMYGREAGDEALRRLGAGLREELQRIPGIGCRYGADTFFLYSAHVEDHTAVLERLMRGLSNLETGVIHLRMGVCTRDDKAQDIIGRFDRARAACNRVRGDYLKPLAYYDENLYRNDIKSHQLVSEMKDAIRTRQFMVYYQPKYRVSGDKPVLCSAEALVRWKHPDMGMISPGVFIPLFESNGMIRELDSFVWRETAENIARWRSLYGVSLPVSVNMSRIDLFDGELLTRLDSICKNNGLAHNMLVLEITESAYTEDMEQAISVIRQLRENGYCIEMDDFGTGYSSLNMLLKMPVDAIKVDRDFMRTISSDSHDNWLIKIIVDIAGHLGVPTIFEGVEEQPQLDLIRQMKGDIVQGYYFSRPLPADQFEELIQKERGGMTQC